MIHFTCDICRKELRPGERERFVVKMEVFPGEDPSELTEADLDDDHLQAISECLNENPDLPDLPPPTQHFRFDLCAECQRRFTRDPLGKKHLVSLFNCEN